MERQTMTFKWTWRTASPLFAELCICIIIVFFFSQWFNVLNRVHRATDEELKGMREESANVKHAAVWPAFVHFPSPCLNIHVHILVSIYSSPHQTPETR